MAKRPLKKANKEKIGSGIDALFGGRRAEDVIANTPDEAIKELSSHFAMLSIEQIERNPDQPRGEFDEVALQELADSISIHGIIQPITVRMMAPRQYQIISGERRWRASQRAGLAEVPAFIRLANDQELLEMALIENIQREDLNAMEIAYSYYRLKEEFSLTDQQLAERVGKHRTTVTNYKRLLGLHPAVIDAIKHDIISMGHARVVAGIDDKLLQKQFLDEILANSWSVRSTEKAVKRYHSTAGSRSSKSSRTLSAEQQQIQDHFRSFFGSGGIKLTVEDTESGKGFITIPFKTYDELTEFFKMVEQ